MEKLPLSEPYRSAHLQAYLLYVGPFSRRVIDTLTPRWSMLPPASAARLIKNASGVNACLDMFPMIVFDIAMASSKPHGEILSPLALHQSAIRSSETNRLSTSLTLVVSLLSGVGLAWPGPLLGGNASSLRLGKSTGFDASGSFVGMLVFDIGLLSLLLGVLSPLIITTGSGGVASLTDPPTLGGTCSDNRPGRAVLEGCGGPDGEDTDIDVGSSVNNGTGVVVAWAD